MKIRYMSGKKKKSAEMSTFQYLSHFLAKSFLYAVLIFLVAIASLTLVYFGDLIYNMHKGNNKLPLFDAYIIVSPSMVPTIMIDDAILVKREDPNKLEIGDIITFSSTDSNYPGLTVTHRIVGKQKTSEGINIFRTKGDANNVVDPALVNEMNIYGKVILKVPELGKVRKFLLTSYGFTLGIIVPALIIIVLDIVKIVKARKQEDLEVI